MNKMPETVALDTIAVTHKGHPVLAATTIVKQPGTIAYRIVLYYDGGSANPFVVHNEVYPEWPDLARPHFDTGSYCRTHREGLERFAERASREASFMDSVYREVERGS